MVWSTSSRKPLKAGSIGFNAEVLDKNKTDIDELLRQVEPGPDLVKSA